MFYDEFVVWIQKTLKSGSIYYFQFTFERFFGLEASILKLESSYFETITLKHIEMGLPSQICRFARLNMFSSFWNSSRQLKIWKIFISFFGLRKNTSKIDGKAPLLAQWDATNTSKVDGKAPTFRSALAGRIFWWQIIEQRHKSQRIANYLALPLTIACPHANRL